MWCTLHFGGLKQRVASILLGTALGPNTHLLVASNLATTQFADLTDLALLWTIHRPEVTCDMVTLLYGENPGAMYGPY